MRGVRNRMILLLLKTPERALGGLDWVDYTRGLATSFGQLRCLET